MSRHVTTTIEDGVARFTFRDESFYKGTALRVKMLTHPDMNASASTTEVAANYEPGTKYTAHGALAPDSAPIGDAPKPAPVDPSPSAEPTVAPSGMREGPSPAVLRRLGAFFMPSGRSGSAIGGDERI